MKTGKMLAAGLAICSAMLLTGCGGGGVDVSANVGVVGTPAPAFDIEARVNGLGVANFDVIPGDNQSIAIPNGSSFEFDSNDAVYWTVYVNGVAVSASNNIIVVGNASITETQTNSLQFAGYATSQGYLPAPIQVTLIATSQFDGTQTAQINLDITN